MADNSKITKPSKNPAYRQAGHWHDGLKDETKYSIWAVVCFGITFLLVLAVFGQAGVLGAYLHSLIKLLFGESLFVAPLVFLLAGLSFLFSFRLHLLASNIIGGSLVILSGLGLAEIIFRENTGGYIGFFVSWPFLKLFEFWASLILFLAVFTIGVLIIFNFPFSVLFKKRAKQPAWPARLDSESERAGGPAFFPESADAKVLADKEEKEVPAPAEFSEEDSSIFSRQSKKAKDLSRKFQGQKFEPPPLDLLEGDKGQPSTGDIKANANIIKRTLQNFGISVEINEICIGPSVTQYALKPAEGVKLSKITALNNDLALALASHPIRIEAPIPGKSLIGIEVPNRSASLVGLKHLLSEDEFRSGMPLLVSLGRNVAGKAVFASLVKMPHLLIAGATGSGKSICIHSLMMSLLYRHAPWELQFLMIDPKRVELTIYNNLPYLLSPVITEPKKAIMSLKWATKEMERRYEVLLEAGSRDISSYHQNHEASSMPYIIVIIDELADIMATYPREFEASIVRLAQMSRAVGIHLVVSTQRPSVEVITGLIKANITSRIAFQVASQVDSRTILDMGGAEKLLGNGDMLYLAGDVSKPKRIQGAFVSEKEVKRVVNDLIGRYEDLDLDSIKFCGDEVRQSPMFEGDYDEGAADEDELYEEARELVVNAKKASSSYLQRRLRIGYARAARLLDILEERGIVGPADGSRPRDILIRTDDNP